MTIDYVARAKQAIIADFRLVATLPSTEKIPTLWCQKKYDKLNLFLEGVVSAEELASPYYWGSVTEYELINVGFFVPASVIQIARIPYLDAILRTTQTDLSVALQQAKLDLTRLTELTRSI